MPKSTKIQESSQNVENTQGVENPVQDVENKSRKATFLPKIPQKITSENNQAGKNSKKTINRRLPKTKIISKNTTTDMNKKTKLNDKTNHAILNETKPIEIKVFKNSRGLMLIWLMIVLIFGGTFWLILQNNFSQSDSPQVVQANFSSSSSLAVSSESSISSSQSSSQAPAPKILIDNKGQKITEYIKAKSGADMGFISSLHLETLGIKPPIDVSLVEQSFWQEGAENNSSNSTSKSTQSQSSNQNPDISNSRNSTNSNSNNSQKSTERPPKTLAEIIPEPTELESPEVEPKTTLEKKNLLVFPKYNIEAPIIHLTFDDMNARDKNGNIDFSKDVNFPLDRPNCKIATYRDTCHPVQKALEKGAVHLPISVQPGEIGTSYIAGHTSNWSFIKSAYNSVFKPLEGRTKNGEEFFIYDNWGRKLKFRIFESLEIRAEDLETAYKKFGDKRTITLQGSVLKWTNSGLQPTHRWLSRGELVLENSGQSSGSQSSSSSE